MVEKTMDKIVALAKSRGFVYPGSEIYGGLANTWDYGNLGVELKNNVKKAWWQKFVQESPYNVGVDCAILMNPQTWVASGHLGSFSDPLMDCKDCHERFRADKIIEDYAGKSDMILSKAETGRANKYAVLALKAQAALYHASPLFTQGKTDEEKKNLWAIAVAANKELIDEAEAKGYGLATNLEDLWGKEYYSNVSSTKEILFARRTASSNTFEGYNFPVGYSSGQGGNCPTQDLVDAFECTDGKSISESPLYDANDPYANRDPRLAKTVVVNGEAWPND